MNRPVEPILFSNPRDIPKGWGKEVQICNELHDGYAGKLLVYDKAGAKSSMHYHMDKHETFYVLSGKFELRTFGLNDATQLQCNLNVGETVTIPTGNPHQVLCVEPGTIIEFSTPDDPHDNYRIAPGDSQNAQNDQTKQPSERKIE